MNENRVFLVWKDGTSEMCTSERLKWLLATSRDDIFDFIYIR